MNKLKLKVPKLYKQMHGINTFIDGIKSIDPLSILKNDMNEFLSDVDVDVDVDMLNIGKKKCRKKVINIDVVRKPNKGELMNNLISNIIDNKKN
jgi:hypothetical protein